MANFLPYKCHILRIFKQKKAKENFLLPFYFLAFGFIHRNRLLRLPRNLPLRLLLQGR